MAVIIFGLAMSEMQWGKFKSSYMFGNRDYYLRRTKFVVYQLAMIFCVVSESLGTAVLSDYVDSQRYLRDHSNGIAVEHNNDYVGMASYNIFCGIFVAFVFGAAFFFDLFWPERHEDHGIRVAWKVCSVMACAFMLASMILQVVIVSTRQAYVTGVSPAEAATLLGASGKATHNPLAYNKNPRAIASVVFAWLGFPCCVISTIVMWKSIKHTETVGPYSEHKRKAVDANGDSGESAPASTELTDLDRSAQDHTLPAISDNRRPSRDEVYHGT